MSIFVSELVCSGGWSGLLDTSLLTEGRAMLLAVLQDFLAVPGCGVCTTWDARLGDFPLQAPNLTWYRVASPDEEATLYRQLATAADAVFVVAPESEGILSYRRELLGDYRGQWLGCGLEAIRLFSSKRLTSQRLESLEIATVQTWLVSEFLEQPDPQYPVVLKPDDGAGSQSTFLCHAPAELRQRIPEVSGQPVVQPFIPGEAWSTAFLVRDGVRQVFPPARQHLSEDGRFSYQGGEIVYPSLLPDMVLWDLQRTVIRIIRSLPNLRGYLGIDWVLSAETGRPVVLEINPRLTTSYLGYRKLSQTNLAEALLAEEPPRPGWRSGRVHYTAAGEVS